MEGPRSPFSQLWESRKKWPWWIRHPIYWLYALVLIIGNLLSWVQAKYAHSYGGVSFVFLVPVLIVIGFAIVGLVFTLRGWESAGWARTTSRSLLLFAVLLGLVTTLLVYAGPWGVHIQACRTVGKPETCEDAASAYDVFGMLAWHAADVVPALDITHSLGWQPPARSSDAVVGVSVLAVRLWVVIGILGVLKRMWDKWGPGGSSPTVSR